jgi:Spermine/spermidine synthase domain
VFHRHVSEERSAPLFVAGGWSLLALVAFVHFLHPGVPGFQADIGLVGGEVFYTSSTVTADRSSLWAFAAWFAGTVIVFALVGQRTAKLFRQFPPLRAYSLDVAGSCAGILAFMLVSGLQLPAWMWFLAAAALFAATAPTRRTALAAAVPVLACALLAGRGDQRLLANPSYTGEHVVRWSPYQKVEFAVDPRDGRALYVNGIMHQGMLRAAVLGRSVYGVPYRARALRTDLPPYRSVLVIGAGSGNDVATALLHGAEHVDAVEIDPVIARLGRERHPAHPYQDPRVTVTITDGRAFLTNTRRRYDLVIFALTDSLVKVSPMAQLRLENYLFTVESIRRAYEILTDTGDVLLYNYYRTESVAAKNALVVEQATGHFPLVLEHREGGLVMMLAGRRTAGPVAPPSAERVDATTDDWPFPYLARRGVPGVYVRAMAIGGLLVLLLGVFLHLRGETGGQTGLALRVAFLLMGAAFLLLETKGVIQFSLLFGTTWVNNSLVFLAVLLLVLAANRLAPRLPARGGLGATYALLMLSCALALAVPLRLLLSVQSLPLRFVLASLLVFAPVFFANLIFSLAFRDREVPENLFGWNLIGATLGGILEYASMAVGYSALTVVVAAFYTLAFVCLAVSARAERASRLAA